MEDTREYIKRRLSELNMTQSELARKLGISRVHISTLLSGKDHMSAERLGTIFEIIGKPSQLTGSTKSNFSLTSSTHGGLWITNTNQTTQDLCCEKP